MPTLQDPLVIITDLDGSLLDHHTYSWLPASRWLDKLIAARLPVVFCTSKTAAEIIPLQESMGLQGSPFIAENGAVVQFSALSVSDPQPAKIMSGDYSAILSIMRELRELNGFKFFGFNDVDEQVIGEWTGLSAQDARLAQRREASEAFIWRDSEPRLIEFTALLAKEGLGVTQGGRFYHVMSALSNKGAAVQQLLQWLQQRDGRPWRSLGLGDGPNDISMLNQVDYAVIIKGYSNNPMALNPRQQQVYRTTSYGPNGWVEGLDYFITPA